MPSLPDSHDVIVVGAGPVGLALAAELSMRGRSVCVLERHERVGVQPRAKTTNARTMAHMRRWGLAEEVRRRRTLPRDFPRRIRFATGLFGHEIHRMDDVLLASPHRDDRLPEASEFIPQYVIERVLHDHLATAPGVTVRMRHEFESFRETQEGIRVEARDLASGETRILHGRYLVGADGGRSAVRAALGIGMEGARDLVSFVTLILRIPGIGADPDLPGALMHWLVDPQVSCVTGPMDAGDVWHWGRTIPPGTTVDPEEMLALVRRSFRRDFPLELLALDYWTVHKLISTDCRRGRAFLAGDACHLHSPFGGHGMNTGVGDAVDLGWKLDAALAGWAGPGLLDSYAAERQPIHRMILETSTENVAALSQHFLAPAIDEDGPEGDAARAGAAVAIEASKRNEFRSVGVVLGFRYESDLIGPDEADEAARQDEPFAVASYTPSARPGRLAPHAWLSDGRSLYDRFGLGHTLLRLGAARPEAEAALTRAFAEAGVPLGVADLAGEGLRALYAADYALVRPDQIVAWRGDVPGDARALVARLRGAGAGARRTAEHENDQVPENRAQHQRRKT